VVSTGGRKEKKKKRKKRKKEEGACQRGKVYVSSGSLMKPRWVIVTLASW
jgi:hypothetical protein